MSSKGNFSSLPAVFPRSNGDGSLTAVDVNSTGDYAYELAALQGIVARTQPSLFLVNSPDDGFWLNYTSREYGISYAWSTPTQALLAFRGYITDPAGKVKIVIYDSSDPLFPTQLDVAKTLAGVFGAIPVGSNDLPGIRSIYGAANLRVVWDVRGMFTDKVTAYSWLWNEVGRNVTRSFLTVAPSGRLGLTDYDVEFKSFVFEFSTTNNLTTGEAALASSILGHYPPMTPVIGFFGLGGEVSTVSLLSSLQMLMVPGDQVMDLSAYSGLPEALNLRQAPAPAPFHYDTNKTYVLFSYSQGNALGFDFYYNRDRWAEANATGSPLRDQVPLAWQINPLAAELAPQMMNYYYQTMGNNDSFYAGASGGAGYVHPDQLPNVTSYLRLAGEFDSNVGVNIPFVITAQSTSLQGVSGEYASVLGPAAILTKGDRGSQPFIVCGFPVIPVTYDAPSTSNFTSADVNATVTALKQLAVSDRFIFVFMPAKNPGTSFILDVVRSLGPGFVPLRADQFAMAVADGSSSG